MRDGEKAYKVVFLGDAAVGKTAIIHRKITDQFTADHKPTIGVTFVPCDIPLSAPGPPVQLQIWDTAGEEKYHSLAPLYGRDADVAVVVCSLAEGEEQTVANVAGWIDRATLPGHAAVVVAANKVDLAERSRSDGRIDSQGRKIVFCSARTGEGIAKLFKEIAKAAQPRMDTVGGVAIDAEPEGCCCVRADGGGAR